MQNLFRFSSNSENLRKMHWKNIKKRLKQWSIQRLKKSMFWTVLVHFSSIFEIYEKKSKLLHKIQIQTQIFLGQTNNFLYKLL